ncbi:MAG: type II secretion system protein GspN [Leptospiraceae bacterium]|nr:type II secretion system protein GspN [Leptospiraceae bacterium]
MADLIEDKSELDPDDELLSLEEELEDDFESTEVSLTFKQKIILVGLGLLSVIIFFVLLFPTDEVVRFALGKFSESSGVQIDFKKISLPIIGTRTIDSFYLLTKDGLEAKAEEVTLKNTDLLKFYNDADLKGELTFSGFDLDSGNFQVKLTELGVVSNLSELDKDLTAISGTVKITSEVGTLVKLPELPILGNLSGTKIKKIELEFQKNGPNVDIKRAMIQLSIARIAVRGKMALSPNFRSSRLDIEICPELSKDFASEREDLVGNLSIFKKGDETCIPIQGTIGEPKPIMPNLGGSPTPPMEAPKENTPKKE